MKYKIREKDTNKIMEEFDDREKAFEVFVNKYNSMSYYLDQNYISSVDSDREA